MKQLTLEEIKQIELRILKRFKEFCEENDIRYFLSNGTLLGAVKYNGFIPWDDDVDVLVPRKDYNRLIKLFQNDDTYSLMSYERDPRFRYPFAKLCDMSTCKVEANIDNGMELGVDIDVFPLDDWDNDLEKAFREVKKINRNMFQLGLTKLVRADSIHPVKRGIKAVLMVLCKLRGSTHYIRKIIRLSDQLCQRNSSYVGCKCWCIYGRREIIRAEMFADAVEVTFEKEIFPAPVGYDTYLRSLYGDYPQDPPPEKQKSHHQYRAYRL